MQKDQAIADAGSTAGDLQWSDDVFEKCYWQPLPRYKRPDAAQLQLAVRYFMQHYAAGSGTTADWRSTIQILLLDLRIPPPDDDGDGGYILANEDIAKVTEVDLPCNMDTTNLCSDTSATATAPANILNDTAQWLQWCNEQFQDGQIHSLSIYFGSMCLHLCSLMGHNTNIIRRCYSRIHHFVRLNFGVQVNNNKCTPMPGARLLQMFHAIFAYGTAFNKEIICRLAQRRIQFDGPGMGGVGNLVRRAQNDACYSRFATNSIGLVYWFRMALRSIDIQADELLEMFSCIGEGFEAPIAALKHTLPIIGAADHSLSTWQISRLLCESAFADCALDKENNLRATAAFIVIAHNITDSKNWDWDVFQQNVHAMPNFIENAISIGQSVRAWLQLQKEKN